jgi:hypothetical protein
MRHVKAMPANLLDGEALKVLIHAADADIKTQLSQEGDDV